VRSETKCKTCEHNSDLRGVVNCAVVDVESTSVEGLAIDLELAGLEWERTYDQKCEEKGRAKELGRKRQ
jgi:hypothetical protein